jgi:hypothetical protein
LPAVWILIHYCSCTGVPSLRIHELANVDGGVLSA